jgi:hypothetical protein
MVGASSAVASYLTAFDDGDAGAAPSALPTRIPVNPGPKVPAQPTAFTAEPDDAGTFPRPTSKLILLC